MPNTISIIVYSIGNSEDPYYFVERNGVWQDYGCGTPVQGLTKLKKTSDGVLDRVAQMVENNPNGNAVDALHDSFGKLYQQLIPQKLRELLESGPDAPAPILRLNIQEKFDWIPWELMRDSKNYLGLRFQISRLPLASSGPALDELTPKTVGTLHNFLGHAVIDNDADLLKVWKATFAPPHANIQHAVKPNGEAIWPSKSDIENALKGDILHLTCHGAQDDTEELYYWALDPNDGQGFLSGITDGFFDGKVFAGGRPLVFANACAFSGKVQGVLTGFGRKLFVCGAQNVVGTFGKVSRKTAIPFAQSFYKRLLNQNVPIGQALHETKLEFHKAGVKDPSHLYYCLYGPPGTKFQYA